MKFSTRILIATTLSGFLILFAGTVSYVNLGKMVEAQKWVSHTYRVISEFKNLTALMVDMETGERGFLMSGDPKFLEPFNAAKVSFDEDLNKLKQTVSDNPTQVGRLEEVAKLKIAWMKIAEEYEMSSRKAYDRNEIGKDAFQAILIQGKGKVVMDQFRGLIQSAIEMEQTLNTERIANNERTSNQTQNWLLYGLSLALLAAGFLLWRIIAPVIALLRAVSSQIAAGSDELAAASSQIATSSVSLSESATQQAASLAETAASLEEISSMIAKSSDSAGSTTESSVESQAKAEEGQKSVEQMMDSMSKISESNIAVMSRVNKSNDQMTEIVRVIQEIGSKTKVINEIVFQTKLLSFNASVEAARAGEHGKGFAVVAEEVGKLAQMSGNAAKEISEMLEGSISKVEQIAKETRTEVEFLIAQGKEKVEVGVSVAEECAVSLANIVTNISKVTNLAHEISNASKEQAQGVAEINKAVSELEAANQQNTSSTQEVASTAERLEVQATSLMGAVSQLLEVVEGKTGKSDRKTAGVPPVIAKKTAKLNRQNKTTPSNVVALKKQNHSSFKAASGYDIPDNKNEGFSEE